MKIAQVAPLFESVRPTAYGGTERVVSISPKRWSNPGHDVTLFASGDSRHPVAAGARWSTRSLRLAPHRPDWLMGTR